MSTTQCGAAVKAMASAPPGELEPGSGSELGRHLERCPRCRRRAAALREGLGCLDEGLEAWVGRGDARSAVERARERLEGPSGAPATRTRRAGRPEDGAADRPSAPFGRRAAVAGALAAVAALVLLLVSDRGPGTPGDRPGGTEGTTGPPPTVTAGPGEGPGDEVPSGLGLRPPPDRTVAVLDTGNPEITIVWFF